MRPIIYPYKMGSKSAKLLSTELRERGHRAMRVRPDGNYRPFRSHLIINWGNSTCPNWMLPNHPVLNRWDFVRRASNKLTAFQTMQEVGVSIPEFTTDWQEASRWLREGTNVVERNILSSHSGRGIIIRIGNTEPEHITQVTPTCPLFVKYIKKQDEYRIHVFQGRVIDAQQKRRRTETPNEEVDYQVRNHANGWIYARAGCDLDHMDDSNVSVYEKSNMIHNEAIKATEALGLDFGAVDIIWNEHHKQCYVLEVNTAPGLEGTTLTKYADAIEALL